jgi:16S rRNA (adenine1518-N6/adenine1519-N6)-dimethyltransferase
MRRIGQNFLVDRDVLSRIADYAELNPADSILEIGAGTGNLTEVLSRRAGRVYAVEVDGGLAMGLKGRFANVKVIEGDALKVELPDYNKVVSNLPYQISSKITYRLLSKPFDLAVLMYQREFAKRLIAAPGTAGYGRLSMVVGHYAIVGRSLGRRWRLWASPGRRWQNWTDPFWTTELRRSTLKWQHGCLRNCI